MALTPIFQISQTADLAQINLTDITGQYSSGNPGGWGIEPNEDVNDVISVYFSGTFRPTPSNAAAITIPSVEIMPTTNNALPYANGANGGQQVFNLTPALLGLPTPIFQDGIIQGTVTINCKYYTISDTGNVFLGNWGYGSIITDTTTGKVIGTVVYSSLHAVILGLTTGNTVSAGNVLTNGNSSLNITLSGAATATFTTTTYTANVQQLISPNATACIATDLAKLDVNCLDQSDYAEEIWQEFGILMASYAASGSTQNNSALDLLGEVENFCNGCGCGCG